MPKTQFPLLMNHAEGSFKELDVAPGTLPSAHTNDYGIVTTNLALMGLLTFAGRRTDDLQAPHLVTESVLVALPDLVLLHAQLGVMIDQAKAAGVLSVPDDFAPIVARQD